jgi:hypothetical protein
MELEIVAFLASHRFFFACLGNKHEPPAAAVRALLADSV